VVSFKLFIITNWNWSKRILSITLCNNNSTNSGVTGICCEEGQSWRLCHGYSRWTSGPGAAAARWLIVLWVMQHWSKELWVVDIYTS